jgi:hypothetical protein
MSASDTREPPERPGSWVLDLACAFLVELVLAVLAVELFIPGHLAFVSLGNEVPMPTRVALPILSLAWTYGWPVVAGAVLLGLSGWACFGKRRQFDRKRFLLVLALLSVIYGCLAALALAPFMSAQDLVK